MTEDAKIARLWSIFHRLSSDHKKLIIKITETIRKQEKTDSHKEGTKKVNQNGGEKSL
jgi:hypothetical protein